MSGWTRATQSRLCPVCKRNKHCSWTSDLSVIDCTAGTDAGQVHPAPHGYKIWKIDGKGVGMLYRQVDGDGNFLAGPTAEAIEKRRDEEAMRREKNRADAVRIWKATAQLAARDGKQRAMAYLTERGIDIARLPGERLPVSISFNRQCMAGFIKEIPERKESRSHLFTWPAMVCSVVNGKGEVTGVHRTFLAIDGSPRKRAEIEKNAKDAAAPTFSFGSAKQMYGICAGGSTRLARDFPQGVLIIAEGIETALACMVATGWTAWAALSAPGIQALQLDESVFAPALAKVQTVVIAADLDARHTGIKAADVLANRIRTEWPHIAVRVAPPTDTVAPSLVEAKQIDGGTKLVPKIKGCDWLDVLNAHGAEAVRAGLECVAAVERTVVSPMPPDSIEATAGGAGAGTDDPWITAAERGERPLLHAAPLVRARQFLWTQARKDDRFGLARWAGSWWIYDGAKYRKCEEPRLAGRLQLWMQGFDHVVRNQRVPLNPGREAVREVLGALSTDTIIEPIQMPTWLPPQVVDGRPAWGEGVMRFIEGFEEINGIRAIEVLSFQNGLLDLANSLRTGKVIMLPHSPRFFTATCLPFDLPVAELQQIIDGCDAGEIYERLCPAFWKWLAGASDADETWESQFQEMVGDTISGNRTIEKIFGMVGVPRAGKGVAELAIQTIVGLENIAAVSFAMLVDKNGLAGLIGKSVGIMSDANLAKFELGEQAKEPLKVISGNGIAPIRELYSSYRTAKIGTRLWIMCNDEPDLRDDSGALAGRFIMLPLRISHAGSEDDTLKERISREGQGIMLWALQGLIRIMRRPKRYIQLCESSRALGEEFASESAHIPTFISEALHKRNGLSGVTIKELFAAYEYWCEHEMNRQPVGEQRFWRAAKFLLPELKQARSGEGGRRERRIPDVAIREQYVPRPEPYGSRQDTFMPYN